MGKQFRVNQIVAVNQGGYISYGKVQRIDRSPDRDYVIVLQDSHQRYGEHWENHVSLEAVNPVGFVDTVKLIAQSGMGWRLFSCGIGIIASMIAMGTLQASDDKTLFEFAFFFVVALLFTLLLLVFAYLIIDVVSEIRGGKIIE